MSNVPINFYNYKACWDGGNYCNLNTNMLILVAYFLLLMMLNLLPKLGETHWKYFHLGSHCCCCTNCHHPNSHHPKNHSSQHHNHTTPNSYNKYVGQHIAHYQHSLNHKWHNSGLRKDSGLMMDSKKGFDLKKDSGSLLDFQIVQCKQMHKKAT